jgi:hypothetical protein
MGEAAFKPTRVFANDTHTFIQLPPGTSASDAPAVFNVSNNETELLNSRLVNGYYIIDGKPAKLSLVLGVGDSTQTVQCEKSHTRTVCSTGAANDFQIRQESPRRTIRRTLEADVDMAAIDGPGQPLEIHTPPPGTKRLSKKGQFLLLGGASTVASAILIGVMISGKSGGDAESKKQLTASDAPGQAAPYKENAEDIQRRATVAAAAIVKRLFKRLMANKQVHLASRSSNPKDSSGGNRTANGGASPPSPAEAHRLWLQKRKYERLQGQIMASDSAETSDISKGGAALAAKAAAGGMLDTSADGEDDRGWRSESKAHSRQWACANARASATTETMRMANLPASGDRLSSPTGPFPAHLAAGSSCRS